MMSLKNAFLGATNGGGWRWAVVLGCALGTAVVGCGNPEEGTVKIEGEKDQVVSEMFPKPEGAKGKSAAAAASGGTAAVKAPTKGGR